MEITDQIGRVLTFDQVPQTIVSLVPSQTELLVDLGLHNQIAGVTKFCVHPKNLTKEKVVVGGTKQVDFKKIALLKPDVILCNKEENTKLIVTALSEIAPVHVSDVKTVQDSLELIGQYGGIFRKYKEANSLVRSIEGEGYRFRESVKNQSTPIKVAYVIWKEPLMVAGGDTFINSILEEIGFQNAFKTAIGRYPEIPWEDLKDLDYIFLSSEPFPFKEGHKNLFQENTDAQVVLVNGEFFSWYGSRLAKAYAYFKELKLQLEL